MRPPDGVAHWTGALDAAAQRALLGDVRAVLDQAPLFRPTMPRSGRPFSVEMSNCGVLGWVSDAAGYRYQPRHPVTGAPWPPMPLRLLALWTLYSGFAAPPEACLINLYRAGAKLGSHVDSDEPEARAPVLSVSLGDTAVFHVGGRSRRDPKVKLSLHSGDVLLIGGASRRAYHGIDRVLAGSSNLVEGGGRINLTLRRVTLAPS